MFIQIYKMTPFYQQLRSVIQKEDVHLSHTNILPLDADYTFIPNDRSIVSFVDVTRTIVVLDAFYQEDVIWWMNQRVLDCWHEANDLELAWTKLKTIHERKKISPYQETLREKFSTRAMKESLAYDLLHGKATHVREIWERSKLAKLAQLPNIVYLLSIDHFKQIVQSKGDHWKNSIRKEVLLVIRDILPFHGSMIVLVNEHQYAILLPLPVQLEEENYRETSIEQAQILQKTIEKRTPYTVSIGIGNRFEDTRNVHISYKESEYAQSYRLFTNESTIIHIQDIDFYETDAYERFKMTADELTHIFVRGNFKEVEMKCAELFMQVKESNIEPAIFRLQMVELLASMTKVTIQHGANPNQIMPLQIKYAKKMYDIESIHELEKAMLDIMTQYMTAIQMAHNETSLRSVQEVLQYIEKHFKDDIGLDMLAEKVGLSPNYLSAVFKQTTGSSFIQYLTELRLKKAKEMLANLHLTIYEIAQDVGFSSSQYFSRVFKEAEGVTPTTYRNNLLRTKT